MDDMANDMYDNVGFNNMFKILIDIGDEENPIEIVQRVEQQTSNATFAMELRDDLKTF